MTEPELEAVAASVATGNLIDPDQTKRDVLALIADVRRLQGDIAALVMAANLCGWRKEAEGTWSRDR